MSKTTKKPAAKKAAGGRFATRPAVPASVGVQIIEEGTERFLGRMAPEDLEQFDPQFEGKVVMHASSVKPKRFAGGSGRMVKMLVKSTEPLKRDVRSRFFSVGPMDAQERVELIRAGVPADVINQVAHRMHVHKQVVYDVLSLPRSSMDRAIANKGRLSKEHSERLLGLQTLVKLVEKIVEESGDPTGFDASSWVGQWLERPQPALAGARPADYMDTMEGQRLVQGLLLKAQAGVYV